MTREECEKRIMEKLEEIAAIYGEYHGDTDFLDLSIIGNHMHINNRYFKDGEEKAIHAWQDDKWGFVQG